jgi:hypothetical protein
VPQAFAGGDTIRAVVGNLRIKEVQPGHDQGVLADRYVCHNPEQADRAAAVRERLLAHLTGKIAGSDALSATKRAELRGGAADHARAAPLPARHPRWAAPRRRRRRPTGNPPGRHVAAAVL